MISAGRRWITGKYSSSFSISHQAAGRECDSLRKNRNKRKKYLSKKKKMRNQRRVSSRQAPQYKSMSCVSHRRTSRRKKMKNKNEILKIRKKRSRGMAPSRSNPSIKNNRSCWVRVRWPKLKIKMIPATSRSVNSKSRRLLKMNKIWRLKSFAKMVQIRHLNHQMSKIKSTPYLKSWRRSKPRTQTSSAK